MTSTPLRIMALFTTGLILGCGSSAPPPNPVPLANPPQTRNGALPMQPPSKGDGKYATVNGLKMYYETSGTSTGANKPLVTLHGAFGVAMAPEALVKGRHVIAVELQGHGHTGDIDRPLTFDQMADDVAALLAELKLDQVDVFGYSMGGSVGLALAIRHPTLVHKLAINGSNHGPIDQAYGEEGAKQFKSLRADFAPMLLKGPYDKTAPDPSQWPTLVSKVKTMGIEFKGFDPEALRAIKCPLLITLGDRDVVRVEHAVELYRLIPSSQLAVFPGGDHFMVWQSPEKLLPSIVAFFDTPQHGGPMMGTRVQ